MPLAILSSSLKSSDYPGDRDVDYLEAFLKLLNLFDLKKELECPISPVTDLEDLFRETDRTLKSLETAFAKISASCSHWTINSLFGSTAIASLLENLVHRVHPQFDIFHLKESENRWQLNQFGHHLIAELIVSISLNSLGVLASLNPILMSLGIISTALAETLVQYILNIFSVQSFSIFTELIRQRLKEYSEFRNFVHEYKVYASFFQSHCYQQSYDLKIANSCDTLKVFKITHTFIGIASRRDLLKEILGILDKDEVFQERLKQKFSQLGVIFLKLLSRIIEFRQ
ncbi:MAG: hypothetical protein J7647_10845 [Cyanobacteria bacterium SBLK]|nr:hypothetical protein [Cyanobacteria bacterium SBLK]